MYSDFAYSGKMQLILMFLSFSINFVLMYVISKLILRIYGEKANVRRHALFAFLTGPVLQSLYVYAIYFFLGMESFTYAQNLVFTSPSPITALLYCYFGIKILKLSPIRSIELMGHVYLYYSIINCLNRFAGSILFHQDALRFNYLMDASRHLLNLAVALLIFGITWKLLDRHPTLFVVKSSMFASPSRDLLFFTFKASFIYLFVVLVPLLVPNAIVANSLIFVILCLFFVATILLNFLQHARAEIHNKEAHISSLIKTSDEFRAVKHDFYNILQTYTGFFAVGDLEACKQYHASLVSLTTQAGEPLELTQRMSENPALVSLLLDKIARAEQAEVHMGVSLKCSLTRMPIDDMDLCRILACLLDNAIEAAAESSQRRVSFSVEQTETSKLIIITNSCQEPMDTHKMSIAGTTSKAGHPGIGLSTVKKILERYAGAAFQLSYYNYELSAYVELRQV